MFHKAIDLRLLEGTALEARSLFLAGKLMGAYGIMWNDELDIEVETIYADGDTVRKDEIMVSQISARAVASVRAAMGISQKKFPAKEM